MELRVPVCHPRFFFSFFFCLVLGQFAQPLRRDIRMLVNCTWQVLLGVLLAWRAHKVLAIPPRALVRFDKTWVLYGEQICFISSKIAVGASARMSNHPSVHAIPTWRTPPIDRNNT